jgi:hypothetical protein
MLTTVLAPSGTDMRPVTASRRTGPPALGVFDVDGTRLESTTDRVRAAILNTGFALPTGCVDVVLDAPCPGADLAIALAIMLTDPAHRRFRQSDIVASGILRLDGSLDAVGDEPLVNDLPSDPWIARFWYGPEESTLARREPLLTLVDVDHLADAWESLLGLHDIGRMLATTN